MFHAFPRRDAGVTAEYHINLFHTHVIMSNMSVRRQFIAHFSHPNRSALGCRKITVSMSGNLQVFLLLRDLVYLGQDNKSCDFRSSRCETDSEIVSVCSFEEQRSTCIYASLNIPQRDAFYFSEPCGSLCMQLF